MKGLHDALPPFLANFVRLRTLAPDPSDPALVALVTHEQAINAFAELELAGKSDRSIAVLQWHLETVARIVQRLSIRASRDMRRSDRASS